MNSRSRVNRLASSAPSQRIAGPRRRSTARSGPTANGISTTTVRKNSTPISAPPPTRMATRISRRMIAARAVMQGDLAAKSGLLPPSHPLLRWGGVGGGGRMPAVKRDLATRMASANLVARREHLKSTDPLRLGQEPPTPSPSPPQERGEGSNEALLSAIHFLP